jgi:hypothetical protein
MKYSDYDKCVFSNNDLARCKRIFEENIASKQKELDEFINRANKRIEYIKISEKNKNYCILGGLRKSGNNKDILLIIRYEDGTQRDEKYSYSKIADARSKLAELKEKHKEIDWSNFKEEI